jgi:tetratricopeptide (TPR) repeat protein
VEAALAYLAWKTGERNTALQHFQAAVRLGGASWKMYWDYARLLKTIQGDRAPLMDALRKTVELKPDQTEARLMLGRELYAIGSYAEALSELQRIKDIDPDHAATIYLTMAYSAAQLKQTADAARYAEQAKKHARRPDETKSVEALLNNLQNAAAGEVPQAPASLRGIEADEDSTRPILRRRESPSPAPAHR